MVLDIMLPSVYVGEPLSLLIGRKQIEGVRDHITEEIPPPAQKIK
jgi:hypothetical protein